MHTIYYCDIFYSRMKLRIKARKNIKKKYTKNISIVEPKVVGEPILASTTRHFPPQQLAVERILENLIFFFIFKLSKSNNVDLNKLNLRY